MIKEQQTNTNQKNSSIKIAEEQYVVVINHEEQYSIWLERKELPAGWQIIGKGRSKDECLEYIEKNWVDMRPASLRKEMDHHNSK